jgi:ligand-binding sensor domain-containing protein
MTNLLKLSNLLLSIWLFLINSALTHAADLTFTPAAPVVEVGKEITLTVSGTSGQVTWSAQKGWIVGVGNQVTYKAPDQAGFDVVVVSDAAGNIATLKVQLLPKSNLSEENAVWKVFSNLDMMLNLAWVEGSNTFLATTFGGLAQYRVADGGLERLFTTADGLPDNQVQKFLSDANGVWIGTANGLAYYSNDKLTRYETPLGVVLDLISDDHGGVWVSLFATTADLFDIGKGNKPGFSGDVISEVAHLDINKQWTVSSPLNSPALTLVNDEHGGIWAITHNDGVNKEEENRGVLRHLLNTGEWKIYTTKELGLSGGFSFPLTAPDGQGGIWVGMKGHIVHFNLAGEWQIYGAEIGLSEEMTVTSILTNKDGTISVAVGSMFFDLNQDGNWVPFSPKFPQGLSLEQIVYSAVDGDGRDGIWMITTDRHLWHQDANKNWTTYPDTSNYPYSTRFMDNVPDGQGGVWIGTTGDGLVHLTKEGQWETGSTPSKLPLSAIYGIGYDTNGGGWILGFQMSMSVNLDLDTTMKLIHCKPEKSDLLCDPPMQDLPPQITNESTMQPKLLPDDKGGLWLSSESVGLFYRNPEGQWTTYDTTNSELPNDKVWAIVNDGNGGLWITTSGGLAHLSQDQQWTIYNTSNSGLPNDDIFALETDSVGGLWIGIGGGDIRGLVHFSSQGEWTIYTTDNSPLPNNNVTALLKGENGGLWIGTGKEKLYGGLVSYLSETGEWTTYETELGSYPRFFISDQQGGIWASTMSSGLAHFDRNGKSILFDSHNSGLPSYLITGLLSDGQGGLWTGNQFGGLAHLTFPEKQTGSRAAILIASGGNDTTNSLWETTESITTYLYKMLAARKFVNEEIYYLSSKQWADFNGDGLDDRIVDAPRPERPLVLDDLRQAFTWAKGRGKLDQPLYVFFMDHGGTEKLQLSKLDYMAATDLKAILDDYQNATGNQLVLVIEACYSGSLLPVLKAPNRAILTSASANETANFVDKQGFTRFFTKYLFSGANFLEAFQLAQRDQNKMLGKFAQRTVTASAAETAKTTQLPQIDDNGDGVYDPTQDGQWLKQLKINGDLQMADSTLTVESLTTATTLPVGQSLSLQAKAGTVNGQVEQVWAVIRPPRMNRVIDTSGTPILAFPRENLYSTSEKDTWQATWNNAVYNGEYEITFYAEDKQGNIAGSETSIIITVTGGVEPPPQATVTFQLEKDRYQRGDTVKATVKEDLGYGYDLYIGVQLPDGHIETMKDLNQFAPLNPPAKWWSGRLRPQSVAMTILDKELATGQYCLYGVLSPAGNDGFEARDKGLWVMGSKCFEVF